MSLLEDFKERFPLIDIDLADALVPVYEPNLCCYYGGSYDNDCDKNAILLLTAHLVVSDPSYKGSSAPSKEQASKSVGSVSVSYVTSSSATDLTSFFNSTSYGQQFLLVTSFNRGAKFV